MEENSDNMAEPCTLKQSGHCLETEQVLIWSLKMELPLLIGLHQIPHTEPGSFQQTIATVWRIAQEPKQMT